MTDNKIAELTDVIDDRETSPVADNSLLQGQKSLSEDYIPVNREITLDEKVNMKKLRTIIMNFGDLRETLGSVKVRGFKVVEGDAVKTILDKYYKQKKKTTSILYGFSNEQTSGRMFAKSTSLQGMSRRIRHTIAKDYYFDLDIQNAHPKLLEHYCLNNNIKCEFLSHYIANREECLKSIIQNFGCDRDEAKQVPLAMINGGGDTYDASLFPRWLQAFYIELGKIRKAVCELNPELYQQAKRKKVKKNTNSWNVDGSTINLLLCDLENNVLQSMYQYCVQKNVKVGVLVFDGLMVYKDGVDNLKEFLKGMEQFVYENHKIDISIIEKEMNEGLNLTEYEDDEEYLRTDDAVEHLITDYRLSLIALKKLEAKKVLFYHKKLDQLYHYSSQTFLYEPKPKEFIMTLIPELLGDCIEDWVNCLSSKLQEDDPDDYIKASLQLTQRKMVYIQSTPGQRNILTQILLRLPDATELIETKFDRIPYLFPICDNQVIDFRTLELRQRTKEDFFTKTTNNQFLTQHRRNDVREYIGEILKTENPAFIDSFLSWFAYCLTGENNVKKFPILVGDGDNGKSVFLNLFKSVIQEFGVIASKKVFKQSRAESVHTEELFPLINKRVSYISEMLETDKFNEDRIKEITGNDGKMSLRGCGGKELQVILDCKLVLITNAIPSFDDKRGFINRLLIIPFRNKFERNPLRVDEIMAMKDDFFTELCYFANKFYRENKTIRFSEEMVLATNEHLEEVDSVKQFIREMTQITHNETDRIAKTTLLQEYNDFCMTYGGTKVSRNRFYKQVETEFKLEIHRDREYKGIKLISLQGGPTFL